MAVRSEKFKTLAYHKIKDKDNFEKQIILLKKKYKLVNLQQLKKFLFADEELPSNLLLITFDDGDRSLYEKAFPVLYKHKVPAVIFVITALIGTDLPFWWDEIEYYLEKGKAHKKIWEVKEWPNSQRETYLEELRAHSTKPPLSYPQLSVSELSEMHNNNIAIANHSHSHPMFNQCSAAEVDQELKKSVKILKTLGFETESFAYPNGNYSDLSENILRKNELKLAFLFDHKLNEGETDPLRISRLVVNDSTPLWKFRLILSGWHSRLLPLSRRIGKTIKSFKQV